MEAAEPNYSLIEFTANSDFSLTFSGDGSRWQFDPDSVQPDITAYELVQILRIKLDIIDGLMGGIKDHPELFRHFRRLPA